MQQLYEPPPTDADGIEVEIEKLSNNRRRIRSKVVVEASLETIWGILTDYDKLADLIPGLAVSQVLDKTKNFARLLQIELNQLLCTFDGRNKVCVRVHNNYEDGTFGVIFSRLEDESTTTLTSWHLLLMFCSLHVALWMKLFEHKPFDPKVVMGFGILNGTSIWLLNLSLGFNSVGFYQVFLIVEWIKEKRIESCGLLKVKYCNSGLVTVVDGLKATTPTSKCPPMSRSAGVYKGSLHLDELNILLSRSCTEYWEERIQNEIAERV